MKKTILILFCLAILLMTVSCDIDKTSMETSHNDNSIDEIQSVQEASNTDSEPDEKEIGTEENADKKPPRTSPYFYNGVRSISNVTYAFNQTGEFLIHIAGWDEDYSVTSLSDNDIAAVKYSNTAICVNNQRAFLILKQIYEPNITVVSFEKDSQNETVVNLDVDEFIYEVSGSFINENIGYIFCFKEAQEAAHSSGSSNLSNLFKTEDGGITWTPISVQNVPLLDLRNNIECTKMISENVGLISAGIGPADYDFCERTLLTTDGGSTWGNVNIPELPQDDNLHWAIVADFILVDESYILTIRYETSENDYAYAEYKLIDQNSWIRIS